MRYPFSLIQYPPAIPDIWRTYRADQTALQREYDPGALHQHAHRALQTLVGHAYHTVPFYRDLWNRHGLSSEKITSAEDLPNLPIVSKADFQQQPQNKLMSTVPRKAWPVLSSGTTTGTRRFALRDAQADLANSLTIRRYFREYGISLGDSVFFLHAGERKPVYSERRWREWGTSRVHIHVLDFVDSPKWMKKADIVAGPASQLEYVACRYAETGLHPPKLFINYAERMSPAACARIKTLTNTPITDVYCASELSTLISFSCQHNIGSHLNSDFLIVEVVNERGKPCPPGEQGEVVVTDLINFITPLIRYRLGDVVTVGEACPCPCGRALPGLIERVEGRVGDRVTLNDQIMLAFPVIRLLEKRLDSPFTLIQETLKDFTLKVYLPDQGGEVQMSEVRSLCQSSLSNNSSVKIQVESFEERFQNPAKILPFVSALKNPSRELEPVHLDPV